MREHPRFSSGTRIGYNNAERTRRTHQSPIDHSSRCSGEWEHTLCIVSIRPPEGEHTVIKGRRVGVEGLLPARAPPPRAAVSPHLKGGPPGEEAGRGPAISGERGGLLNHADRPTRPTGLNPIERFGRLSQLAAADWGGGKARGGGEAAAASLWPVQAPGA
eukprot:gene1919-biopygen3063